MFLNQIVWLLFVPVLVFVSYRIILWALKKTEKKLKQDT